MIKYIYIHIHIFFVIYYYYLQIELVINKYIKSKYIFETNEMYGAQKLIRFE